MSNSVLFILFNFSANVAVLFGKCGAGSSFDFFGIALFRLSSSQNCHFKPSFSITWFYRNFPKCGVGFEAKFKSLKPLFCTFLPSIKPCSQFISLSQLKNSLLEDILEIQYCRFSYFERESEENFLASL